MFSVVIQQENSLFGRYGITFMLTFTILNIKVVNLDKLHKAPIKITAKYVTELIKLLPLLGRKKKKT